MKSLVVYESLWGNTAAIARAVAEGIGPDARAASTTEASALLADGVDLLVVGAPLLGFNLPTDSMVSTIRNDAKHRQHPPDTTQPSMTTWLTSVPAGPCGCATFETRIWWSPGSAAKKIARKLAEAGYVQVADPERFIVDGTYGPLRSGEIERARAWGTHLASQASRASA